MAACPTGALTNKAINNIPIQPRATLDAVDTVCPYCGVGCALTYYVDRERGGISFAEGRDQPGNQGRLCVKGRYGWDYAASPQRLTKPLIRIADSYPKGPLSSDVKADGGQGRSDKRGRKPGGLVPYEEVMPHFREASWEEALDLVARRLGEIYAESGSDGIAGFGSAKCSNEEAYLFQKLIRTGFRTNNVDHCTRLCHASSVAALFEGVGSGAVSTTYGDIANADVAIITGSNATANHPVASSFFKQARRRGTKIIYVDPRAGTVAEHADIFCQLKPGTDVAFYNGIMHEVIRLGLIDRDFIANRTSNYDQLAKTVRTTRRSWPRRSPASTSSMIREVARLWGEAGAGVIYWGMGISQHTTGTDNARCLIAMCAITGNVGRPGTGLHPLRGQNNVQGASDAGLIPMFYPDYQSASDEQGPGAVRAGVGHRARSRPGLTVTEIIKSILRRRRPRDVHARREPVPVRPQHQQGPQGAVQAGLPGRAGHLPHRDRRVRRRDPAGHLLPGEGRHLHQHRPPGAARPQGVRPARCRPGSTGRSSRTSPAGSGWTGTTPRRARSSTRWSPLMPDYANLSHDNLGSYRQAVPERGPGAQRRHRGACSTSGSTPTTGSPTWCRRSGCRPRSCPDEEYPFVLNTGRLLEHWHTGSMTRRSFALDSISPRAEVYVNPEDAAERGLVDGELARVTSRRGTIVLHVKVSHREARGNVFIPFHFREAAANLLTIDEIDPFGKIPEFKFCAVSIAPAGDRESALVGGSAR